MVALKVSLESIRGKDMSVLSMRADDIGDGIRAGSHAVKRQKDALNWRPSKALIGVVLNCAVSPTRRRSCDAVAPDEVMPERRYKVDRDQRQQHIGKKDVTLLV